MTFQTALAQVRVDQAADGADAVSANEKDFLPRRTWLGKAERTATACPIATVALEVASTNEPLRLATAEVFEAWTRAASERLVSAGLDRSVARRLALVVLTSLEGAFVLCQATKSIEPMEAAGQAAADAVAHALGEPARQIE
jgi:hypothetical protein